MQRVEYLGKRKCRHLRKMTHKLKKHQILKRAKRQARKKHRLNYWFNSFAKSVSEWVGNAWAFIFALLIVLVWGISGHYFKYSDTWQLVINTGTTIITFLVVFLIQNTQNRDTKIMNLKLDELIRAKKGAENPLINLGSLSDAELKELEKEYIRLCKKRTGE